METLPKFFRTRKLQALLMVMCYFGLRHCASKGYEFNGFVFLIFLGFLASGVSLLMLTKMKYDEKHS